MRLLLILITITVLSEAKKRRPDKKITEKKEEISKLDDEVKYVPVPFGHIFKEGFEPHSNQPVDLLEIDKKYAADFEEMREKTNKDQLKHEPPKGFASPKDSFFFGEKEPDEKEIKQDKANKKKGKEDKPWLDLVGSHSRNLAMTRRRFPGRAPQIIPPKAEKVNLPKPADANYQTKEQYFSRKSFGLEQTKKGDLKNMNWTKCAEFGRNADFHPKDVINIDWVPFYSWSSKDMQRSVAFIHKFSYPTIKMVQKYKKELGPYLNNSVNWEEPKLYLKADMEMLLVAADRRGQFNGIPYNEVPSSMKNSKITVPTINLRLKIVDPYLAMMFCDIHYATIMAVSGSEPTTINDIRSEAATLKFKGRGYPVARDLEGERMRAKYEIESRMEREKDKYIEAKDMVEDRFPFE